MALKAPIIANSFVPPSSAGPTPDRSVTSQYHYYREPVEDGQETAAAEERRKLYAHVTSQEDFATGFKINRGLGAIVGEPRQRIGVVAVCFHGVAAQVVHVPDAGAKHRIPIRPYDA